VAEPVIDWDLRIAQMRANVPRLKEAMEVAEEREAMTTLDFDSLTLIRRPSDAELPER